MIRANPVTTSVSPKRALNSSKRGAVHHAGNHLANVIGRASDLAGHRTRELFCRIVSRRLVRPVQGGAMPVAASRARTPRCRAKARAHVRRLRPDSPQRQTAAYAHRRRPDLLPLTTSPVAAFTKGGPARKIVPCSFHDDRHIRHRRHIGPARRTRPHHHGDLCNALGRTHPRLIVENPAKVVAVREDLILIGQVRAAAVHEVDAQGNPQFSSAISCARRCFLTDIG